MEKEFVISNLFSAYWMSKCRVKGENPKVLKTKTKRDKQITLGYPQVVTLYNRCKVLDHRATRERPSVSYWSNQHVTLKQNNFICLAISWQIAGKMFFPNLLSINKKQTNKIHTLMGVYFPLHVQFNFLFTKFTPNLKKKNKTNNSLVHRWIFNLRKRQRDWTHLSVFCSF